MDTETSDSTKTTPDYNNLRNRNILKTILYFFFISQYISGIDFGFSKLFSENVQKFTRNFTIFEACMYSVVIFASILIYPNTFLVIFPFLFQYVLNVVIFLIYKKYNISDFLCHISEFCQLNKNDTNILIIISIIHFIVAFFVNIISIVMLKVYALRIEPQFNQLPLVFYLFLILIFSVLDLVAIFLIVIFYYVYNTMKHLKVMLISSDRKVNFISKRYKAIIDICENIRPLCDSLVSKTFFSLITHKHESQHCKQISF